MPLYHDALMHNYLTDSYALLCHNFLTVPAHALMPCCLGRLEALAYFKPLKLKPIMPTLAPVKP